MENLTIKNLSLPDKEKIINFTYNFSGGRTYIIYSENSDILKLLSDFIFYCEDDLIGEINFFGIAVKDFDRYTYRRNIVSRIESGFEQPEYLTAREYLKLYEFKEHKIESLLEYFGFPYDKLDKKIEELSNAEKNILEISKPYIKGSQIILSNLFFAHVVKSSATSSLIARVPEVKLFGLAQTEILRIDTEEVVLGAH